jgi:hypothetical protein
MIRDVLLPALQSRFPSRGFRADASPNAIGSFPSAHEQVGDVTIWDDGDEATVGTVILRMVTSILTMRI